MSRCPITLHETLTPRQEQVLKSKANYLLLCGPAGTAKTYTGMARGLQLYNAKEVSEIVIIRSAVPTRDIGFLPGDADEKLAAYAAPYVHLIKQLSPRMDYQAMITRKVLRFEPTSFLRGQTFDNAYILVDEYQNLTKHELDTVAGRVGAGTHLCLSGDTDQSDLPLREQAGHKEVIATFCEMEEFEVVEFQISDIVRSDFVRSYYEAKRRLASGRPRNGHQLQLAI